jgi:rod shape determining protein RodA
VDWPTVILYFILVFLGWLNIYAAVYDESAHKSIWDLSMNSGRQLIWIGTSVLIIILVISLDFRFFDSFAYIIYGLVIILLLAVLVAGREVAGSTSWFDIGGFRLQPSEFAKFSTALAIAKFLGEYSFKWSKPRDLLIAGALILTPAILTLFQGDTGTALVFGCFVIVFYREGFNPTLIALMIALVFLFVLTLLVSQVILIGGVAVIAFLVVLFSRKTMKRIMTVAGSALLVIGVIVSVEFFVTEVLKPHQQNRIKSLVNPDADPLGYGWNVTQSKIAIGSGGFAGKGYLNGTQTKFDFVPAQSTDFIFCTLGEERGWLGSVALIVLFVLLLIRIVDIAERQKSRFARIYGYGVASLIFFHFMVNIGMTIGLFPVIGIPLPFFSYGGSSLWAFTILLFVLIKIDAHRLQVYSR